MTDYTKMTTSELEQALNDLEQVSKYGNTRKELEGLIEDVRRQIASLEDDLWQAEGEMRTLKYKGDDAITAKAIIDEQESRAISELLNLKIPF